jgi:hypothetical protein
LTHFKSYSLIFMTLILFFIPLSMTTANDKQSLGKSPDYSNFERYLDLDIDGNGQYDALTDGLLVLRYMFGLSGDPLIGGVIASDAIYSSAEDIEARIAELGLSVDIDDNGDVDALTDGLIILRYLFGLRGDALMTGVISPDSQRSDVGDIESHLLDLSTLYFAPVVTSSSNFKIPENQTSIGSVSVLAMGKTSLNFSLGGLDSGDISISDVGLLSFKSTADYEVKALYSLKLKVSDGITEVEQDITVTLVDVEEEDFSPDYDSIPGIDPEHLPGTYSVSSCKYKDGESFKLLSEANITESQKLALYAQDQTLTINGVQYTIICKSDWEIKFQIKAEAWAGQERKDLGIYGLSFFSRIYRDMDIRRKDPAGVWGQWLQPNSSHPFSALSSIEGGISSSDAVGRSYYPKYMASAATHFYNPKSSINGWGFYDRRVSCDYYGGVQIANTLLMPPNLISFDEDQYPFSEEGGLLFGHAWIALPLVGGKERVDWSNKGAVGDTSTDLGKLSWTFFAEAKNFSGPVYAYVPEFWSRRLDRWNALEVLLDSGWDESLAMTKPLKDFYAGRISREELMTTIVAEDWYVDGSDNYVFGREDGYYWSRAEDTFGYTPSGGFSIGAERDAALVFKELDENGDTFIKVFLPKIPSANNLEPFMLSSRSYGVETYNYFLDFFQDESDIKSVNTNLSSLSHPLIVNANSDPNDVTNPSYFVYAEDEKSDFWSDISGTSDKLAFKSSIAMRAETVNRGVDVYFDWRNSDDRGLSKYYKVITADSPSEYQFVKTSEQSVPEKLKNITYENTKAASSFMPHNKTNTDLVRESEIKNNMREIFEFEASPYDFSCWSCVEKDGCDPTVYVARLDDGSKVRYRWYRFKDQPTFKKLKVDYPEVYTDEYLNKLQDRVENIHEHWINKKTDFLSKPETANGKKVNLIEIDHGQIVSPPANKEKGWIPIVLSVESPHGKWKTDMINLEGPNGRLISDF